MSTSRNPHRSGLLGASDLPRIQYVQNLRNPSNLFLFVFYIAIEN